MVVTGGTRTLIVQPSSPDKAVRFDINEDSVKIKDKPHKGSWFRKAKTAESDADPLVEVTFTELLKLNIPDWYLVILGVFCSTVLGALFPLMAILFSGLLEVRDLCKFVVMMSIYIMMSISSSYDVILHHDDTWYCPSDKHVYY